MQYEIEGEKLVLDAETIVPIGLIINELVTNSLKYAFQNVEQGKIKIQFQKEQENILLCIADNGVGMPQTIDLHQTNSLGLRLVNSLTKQIGGTIQVVKEQGTAFTIQFAVPQLPTV